MDSSEILMDLSEIRWILVSRKIHRNRFKSIF